MPFASGASDPLLSVIGSDGTIDLTGEGGSRPAGDRPSVRPPKDAWLAERSRRSLAPPTRSASAASLLESAEAGFSDTDQEIADRFALGDFAGALSAAELRLGVDPTDESARQFADSSRERLEARYTTRIGSLDYLFNLAVSEAKVKWLGLDPQAAFLLSLVDGQTTAAEVLELCGMPRLEALRVFTELIEARAIARVA